MSDTREKYIAAATEIFADRGFYGTSIATVAAALPFTKQALLHHFGSKEKLYSEVLARISSQLNHVLDDAINVPGGQPPAVADVFVAILGYATQSPQVTRLLVRELLDNRERADNVQQWHLKDFVDRLTRTVMQNGIRARADAVAIVFQLLGAINYLVIAMPTLNRMLPRTTTAKLTRNAARELTALIRLRFAGS